MKRPRLLAGLLLAGTVAVVVIVLDSRSPSPRATENTSSAAGSATVQRRDLVETDTESGTLSYADPQTVYNRLSGTITSLPSVGQVIEQGQTLYSVNGHPVVLLDGALSAYRPLKAGDSDGVDILQLNRDLVRMGFAEGQITIEDAWQAGTTDAVKRWQASLGETQTGKIPLGQVVFLPGTQRVTQLETTCGSTGGDGGLNSGSGSGSTNGCGVWKASATAAPRPEFVDFTTPNTTTPTTTTTATTTTPTTTSTTPTTTTTTPENTKSPSGHKPGGSGSGSSTGSGIGSSRGSGKGSDNGPGSAKGSSNRAGSGSRKGSSGSASGSAPGNGKGSGGGGSSGSAEGSGTAGSASAILQTTSIKLVVTVDLAASELSQAKVGEHVTVEMPVGSTVGGTIASVSPAAQNSGSSSSSGGSSSGSANGAAGGSNGSGSAATVPVTITLNEHVDGAELDQAPVSVNFAQAKAKHVLSVPVTALVATSGDTYAVQEAAPPHMLLPVRTGLFAAGYVQISGSGIHPGLKVTDSQG